MNKRLIISILICIILILCKYYFSNYSIEYKVNNYKIKEIYSKKRFYYEIKEGNHTYNFDYYKNRSFSKSNIKKIDEIKSDDLNCIYFKIKDVETYPLCYENGIYTDYNVVETDMLDNYKTEKYTNNKDYIEKYVKLFEIENKNIIK